MYQSFTHNEKNWVFFYSLDYNYREGRFDSIFIGCKSYFFIKLINQSLEEEKKWSNNDKWKFNEKDVVKCSEDSSCLWAQKFILQLNTSKNWY